MISMSVKVLVDREILLWAIDYLLRASSRFRKGKTGRPSRAEVLDFLRSQIGQFGTSHDTLMGSGEDFEPRPEAEEILSNLFPTEYSE